MSRSSPGRYSLHDFAKNVYDVHAFAADGRELPTTRPDPYGWTVAGHGGSVTVKYKVYGDRVDGTYLGIDTTHAHINMPAAIMWARGLDDRPARVTFVQPAGHEVAGRDAAAPGTVAARVHRAQPAVPDGQPGGVRAGRDPAVHRRLAHASASSLHHTGTDGRARRLREGRREDRPPGGRRSSASTRTYEPGTYTFLADYLPWANGDGMEHRNSTVITVVRDRLPAARRDLLDTVAHEFFHGWNVERIRPQGARAVRLRSRQHLGRAVARRRVHAVLRAADAAARAARRRRANRRRPSAG